MLGLRIQTQELDGLRVLTLVLKLTCCVTLSKVLNSVHPSSFFLCHTGSVADIYLFMGVVSTRNPGVKALDKCYFKEMQAEVYSSAFH